MALGRTFTNRRIMAAMVVAFWGHMATYPQDYTSGSYSAIDGLVHLRWWAVAFVAVGIAMFATRHIAPIIALGALLCGWMFGLVTAVYTGDSQSPAGAAFIAGYLALLVTNAGRQAA